MPLKLASICTETHPTKHTASIKHGEGDGKEDRAHTGMEGKRRWNLTGAVCLGSWWESHRSGHVVVVTAVTVYSKKDPDCWQQREEAPGVGSRGAACRGPSWWSHMAYTGLLPQELRQLGANASHQGHSADSALRPGPVHPLPGMDPTSSLPGEEQLLNTNHPGSTNSRYSELR